MATFGYGSATSIHGIAQETMGSDKPFIVLYIGDWDPSGLQMSEIDLPERLARYGGAAGPGTASSAGRTRTFSRRLDRGPAPPRCGQGLRLA